MRFRLKNDENGNIAITFAIGLSVILVVITTAIDLTSMVRTQTKLQDAADAAVLAGVIASDDKQIQTAQNVFAKIIPGNMSPTVTYENSILSLSVQKEQSRIFPLIGDKEPSITVKSAAIFENNNDACIYVLDPTQNHAMFVSMSGLFESECGIQVNSTNSTAFMLSLSGTYDVTSTNVAGSYRISSAGTVVKNPTPNAGTKTDPLAGLSEPDTKGLPCDFVDTQVSTSGSATLQPGVYCGGLNVSASGRVTMQSGQYVFRDGDFRVSLSGELIGDDVFFVFEGESRLDTSSSGDIRLTSDKTGSYKGILMFQERTGGNPSFNLSMSGSTVYDGVIYAPRAAMNWSISGNLTQPVYMPLIVNTLNVSSSGSINLHIPDDDNLTASMGGQSPRLIR